MRDLKKIVLCAFASLVSTLAFPILLAWHGTDESQTSCFVVNQAFEILASDANLHRKRLFINDIMPQASTIIWAGLEQMVSSPDQEIKLSRFTAT